MDTIGELQFYMDLYNSQHERLDRLRTDLTVPYATITALLGGGAYLVSRASKPPVGGWSVLYIVMLTVMLGALIYSTIYLVLSYMGRSYAHLPMPSDLKGHEQALREYCHTYGRDEGSAGLLFQSDVIDLLVAATDINVKANDSRARCMHRAKNGTVVALLAGALALIPTHPDEIDAILSIIRRVFRLMGR